MKKEWKGIIWLIIGLLIVTAGTIATRSRKHQGDNGTPIVRSEVQSREKTKSFDLKNSSNRIDIFKQRKNEIDKRIQFASDDAEREKLVALSARYDGLIETLLNTHQQAIVGGVEDEDSRFPYQAALIYTAENQGWETYFCSASFINSRWLVTAAHCFESVQKTTDFLILADPSEDLIQAAKSPLEVEKFCKHEGFIGSGVVMVNDIALIKLKSDQPVRSIDLIGSIEDATLLSRTFEATVSGWGDIRPGAYEPQKKLNFARIKIVTNRICNNAPVLAGHITAGMRCIEAKSVGPCQGDSGSPLVIQGYMPLLEGIDSGGGACGQTDYAVFTRVSQYRKWIQTTMDKDKDDHCIIAP